jgi:hypothetical protein
MSNGTEQQSLGDLAALLVREIAQALLLAREDAPFVEVRSIKLRLGQLPGEDNPETAEDELILSERYPLLDQGWQLELELDNQAQAKLGGEPLSVVTGRTALDLFGPCSTVVIKGVSSRWQSWLGDLQINTVNDLAVLDDQSLQELTLEHSQQAREFRSKARLLGTLVPSLPSGPLHQQNLAQLLRVPEAELHDQLGRKTVSVNEMLRFTALLDALSLAIDTQVLRKLRLEELLGGTAG